MATRPDTWLRMIQRSPSTTSTTSALPSQFSTRTEMMFACTATPVVVPAAIAATCVPWPPQSDDGGSTSDVPL